jgi:hypothetical protein
VSKDRTPYLRMQLVNPSTKTITIRQGDCVASGSAVDLNNIEAFVDMGEEEDSGERADLHSMSESQDSPSPSPSTPVYTSAQTLEIDAAWRLCPEVQDIDLTVSDNIPRAVITDLKRRILEESRLFAQVEKTRPEDSVKCIMKLAPGTGIFFRRTRMVSPPQAAQLNDMIQQQLSKGVLEPSESPFSSPVLLVPKSGGRLRFVVDLRSLNKAVERDNYTLPRSEESFAAMHGSSYFSAVDLTDAFWSVELEESCRKYTAFQTPSGAFQYRVMPQGYKNASQVFCRFLDQALGPLKFHHVMSYIDDLGSSPLPPSCICRS